MWWYSGQAVCTGVLSVSIVCTVMFHRMLAQYKCTFRLHLLLLVQAVNVVFQHSLGQTSGAA